MASSSERLKVSASSENEIRKIKSRDRRFSKNPTYFNKRCSYCSNPMVFKEVTQQVKKTPPPGAKELDIWETISEQVWKCEKCGGVQKPEYNEIFGCQVCRHFTASAKIANSVPDMGVSIHVTTVYKDGDVLQREGCTNCEQCAFCGKPLKTREYWFDVITYLDDKSLPLDKWIYRYYHAPCAILAFDQEERIKKGLCKICGQQISFIEKISNPIAHQKCEQEDRIKRGVCIKCGKPLDIMEQRDKLTAHRRCY